MAKKSKEKERPSALPGLFKRGRASEWLTLAANIGVIIGLVLVILELNQNQTMMRAQTRHELSTTLVELLLESATNQQLSSVMYRASQGQEVTPEELYQFRMRSNALLRYWEDVHYQYRLGLYDEEEFSRQRLVWRNSLTTAPGFRKEWCDTRQWYSTEYAAEMDSMLPEGACAAAE